MTSRTLCFSLVFAAGIWQIDAVAQEVLGDQPVTYRRFRVVEKDGQVAAIDPIPADPLPLWARDVSQQPHDWSHGPKADRPFFEAPIVFVIPPPEDSGEPFHSHNHQPDITWLPNGDLLAIWYTTRQEVGTELTVLASRLRAGSEQWEPAYEFFKADKRNMHGNSIFHDGDGTIHHMNGMAPEGARGWARLALLHRTSRDNGVTWSVARPVSSGAHYQRRHQVIAGMKLTADGALIQPCDATPGGQGPTAIHVSRDGGRTWADPGGDIRGIHAGVEELENLWRDIMKHYGAPAMLLTLFAWPAVADTLPQPAVRWEVEKATGPGTVVGFTEIDDVEHVELMRVTPETGTYSHHAHILHDGERFFTTWSNHRVDEDGPGQRVLFSTSADGRQWTEPAECFPPWEPAEPAEGQASLVLTSNGLHQVGGTVYAVAGINGIGPRRFGSRPCYGNAARSVAPDGTLGPMFMLADEPPPSLEGFEQGIAPPGDPRFAEAAAELIALRYRPDNCPSWSFRPAGPGHEDYTVATGSWKSFGHSMLAADGHRMCEPTSYRRPDGVVVRLFRDLNRSRRVYASVFDEAQETWSGPQRTNIPDSPSRAVAGRLPNGGVYLVGNQTWAALEGRGGRDPLVLSVSRDGVTFDRAWTIRAGAPKMRHRGRHKGPGFQYPHATVVGDDLWVIYSINKEDVAVTRIPLAPVLEAMAAEPGNR